MKVKVMIRFKDKYTKMWHEVNDELTVSAERYEEIKKFVDVVISETSKKTSSKNRKGESKK